MMMDAKGVLLVLGLLAFVGFIGGAIASIWLGSIAMLYGSLGVPIAATVIVVIALAINMAKS